MELEKDQKRLESVIQNLGDVMDSVAMARDSLRKSKEREQEDDERTIK